MFYICVCCHFVSVGMGLFAKHFIAAGSIIVEHRGIARTASSFSSNNSVVNNNLTDRVADKGSEGYFIEFSAPSSLINDAAWVYNRAYTAGELMQMYEHDSREYGVLPDTPGFSTNVARVKFTDNPNENAALFIMATVDIPAGAELFCSYGKSFWKYDLFSQVLVEDIPKS